MGIRFKVSRGNFVDTLRVFVQGGPGGSGSPKFGGIGGSGGSVYVEAKKGFTLQNMRVQTPNQRYQAGPGTCSRQFSILGGPGQDIFLQAPAGSVCTTDTGHVLGEVNEEGEKVLLARGGDGGSPTNGFIGQLGEKVQVKLVLKTIADAALVGFPNAGKSTLLRQISRARPKVASYPFTTIRPYVGIIEYPDQRQVSMADLPGLIEGAWANKGLGHSFLRHLERTKLMIIVVDVNGFQLSPKYPYRSPLDTLMLLNKELELYMSDLLDKPAMLLVNKMDTPKATDAYNRLIDALSGGDDFVSKLPEEMRPTRLLKLEEIIGISAKANTASVMYVKERIRALLDTAADTLRLSQGEDQDTGDVDVFRDKMRETNVTLI